MSPDSPILSNLVEIQKKAEVEEQLGPGVALAEGVSIETKEEAPKPYAQGAYTIFPWCACGCKKAVKVANALVRAVGEADWFRARHNPVFTSTTVTFKSKEKEEKNG
jgi:hypothetical protein